MLKKSYYLFKKFLKVGCNKVMYVDNTNLYLDLFLADILTLHNSVKLCLKFHTHKSPVLNLRIILLKSALWF